MTDHGGGWRSDEHEVLTFQVGGLTLAVFPRPPPPLVLPCACGRARVRDAHAHPITAARTHSTSGRCEANCRQLSPSSADAYTSPLRLPK